MKTLVIAGGTDGIGRALALACLERGDTVVVVGRGEERAKELLARRGVGARVFFLKADLRLLAESRRVVEEVKERFPVVDALVLCARCHRSARVETAEGIEENLALLYLSRYLLSHGLVESLVRAERPVIVNVAGSRVPLEAVRWDDLGLARDYHGGVALGQGGTLNELLGVAFAETYGAGRIRYVLIAPADIRSGSEEGVGETPASILAVVDDPPADPLSAFVEGRRTGVADSPADRRAAARLRELTRGLLTG